MNPPKIAPFLKGFLFGLLCMCWLDEAPAATDESSVKLAILSESTRADATVDLLTAKFSRNDQVRLLERAEIEKVYHEQGVSALNSNEVKLGRILGADGLLLLNVVETPAVTNLTVRLIAVKPGIVLTDGSFDWPLKDMSEWSDSVSAYLNTFLPKLALSLKEAVPISVVNLRSAIASTLGAETERQLQLLAIQRLAEERSIFVLERQKMQLLSEEKSLSGDESTFWNGAYLLDGVVDQNGYAEDTVTINARLTPPKGGVQVSLEASGARTNLAEVVNRLANKVVEALKIASATNDWSAAEEAAQYYNEAKWALRWGVFKEARAAADSAWVLGKHDQDCATARIKAYELSLHFGYRRGEFTNPRDTNDVIQTAIQEAASNPPWGLILRDQRWGQARFVKYVFADSLPDPANIELARNALEFYYEFGKNAPEDLLKVASEQSNGKNSDWYNLGVEDLTAASQVLQQFNFVPEAQNGVSDKLADLRGLARTVAEWISKSLSVHDSYFTGDRLATHDELSNTMEQQPNIFRCEANWGCFWQERPEDCIALYRELLQSPVFCYVHKDFWLRGLQMPRLVAWRDEDRRHLPGIWNDFLQELISSTNVLWELEGRALLLADADNDQDMGNAFTNLFNQLIEKRNFLVSNPVEVLYLNWCTDELINNKTGEGLASDTKDSVNQNFYSQFRPKLEAMDQEYWQKTIPARQMVDAFEKQKRFLTELTPYDWNTFNQVFESREYTKAQAAELQPLIAAYKSNWLAHVSAASPLDKAKSRGDIRWFEFFLEQRVASALNAPATPSPSPAQPPMPQPHPAPVPRVQVASKGKSPPASNESPDQVTNILSVTKFLPIPMDGLPGDHPSTIKITAHHWVDNKLVLDGQYGAFVYAFDSQGNWTGTRNVVFGIIAVFEPVSERWQVISGPELDVMSWNQFYHRTTLYHGSIFTSNGGHVTKFNFAKNAWQVLNLPDIGNCELFTVNDHLYGATANLIVEILDDGGRTHILASNRRQPPASSLDSENLGMPFLFSGPGHSLRVAIAEKIAEWDGTDWHTVCPAPHAPSPPLLFDDAVLFRANGWNAPAGIWWMALGSNQVDFCLGPDSRSSPGVISLAPPVEEPKPTWKLPREYSGLWLSCACRRTGLCLLKDHSLEQDIINEQQHLIVGRKLLAQNGYHAELLCYDPHFAAPQKIFLKFESHDEDAVLPVTGDKSSSSPLGLPGRPSPWLLFSSNYLFCAQEAPDSFPTDGGSEPDIRQPKAGIWMVPSEAIDHEVTLQKSAEQQREFEGNALARLAAKRLLEKYDSNHNGVIDMDEREQALGDPVFIQTELGSIDTNHNGWLDASELVYFDANQNKILDQNEKTGIEIASHLLAQKLLDQFDKENKGWLDRNEYDQMIWSSLRTSPNAGFLLQFPHVDVNHDNHVELEELENVMRRHLETGFNSARGRGPGFMFPSRSLSQEDFKAEVESFWQNSQIDANRLPASNHNSSQQNNP